MRTHALRWLTAGVLAYLVFFPTLIRGQIPASKAAEPAVPSPRWITHQDPQRYSVESPPGWTVFPDKGKGWGHLMGT